MKKPHLPQYQFGTQLRFVVDRFGDLLNAGETASRQHSATLFSGDSTDTNDENMLVIRGNTMVADIYLTEFFRLWNHYAFREWLAKNQGAASSKPQYLKTDDTWRNIYFGDTEQSRQRVLFSGAAD